MHSYATNSPQPVRLIAIITFLAIAISTALGYATSAISEIWIPIGGVSSMAVFWGLWIWFDRYLWKHQWLRKLLLVPDLNGVWTCSGHTLLKDGSPAGWDWKATIRIVQSWSKIRIVLETTQSDSHSISASLYKEDGAGYRLIYHYDNKPKPGEADLKRHCGLTNLLFDEDAQKANGSYFTDMDRITTGKMTLNKNGVDDDSTGKA